jgi:catechol 2,3-dioxygenase-like lactoylglutathione lyase family enzyme
MIAPADERSRSAAEGRSRRWFVTQFLAIMPALRVTDLQRSLDWYTGVLGFDAQGRASDDGGGEYCFVRAGDVEVLLSTGSHLGGPPAFTGTLYFRVAGVDALFARVDERAEVVWPLELQEYGTREFGIRDPDGYLLAFAEGESLEPVAAPDPGGI